MSIECDDHDFTNNRPKTNYYDDLQEINITHESGLVKAINFTLGFRYRLMYNSPFGDSIIQGGQKLDISEEVYYGNSVASIGVAAHETGHAIQHKESYSPLVFRNKIFPVVNIRIAKPPPTILNINIVTANQLFTLFSKSILIVSPLYVTDFFMMFCFLFFQR